MAYPSYYSRLRVFGTGGGVDLPVNEWEFDFHGGEQAQASATVINTTGEYGPSSTLLDCTRYNASFVLLRWFVIEATVGGQPWSSPWLLQSKHGSVENADSSLVTVEFTDLSALLLTKGLFMPTVESTQSGGIKWAKATLAEILAFVGITSYDFSDYPDHRIQLLHRCEGTPLDWIREIIERMQGRWFFRGKTFVLRQGGRWNSSKPANWRLVDRLGVKVLNHSRSTDAVYNEGICQRVDASSGVAFHGEGTGRGWVDWITLDFPVTSATIEVYAPGAGQPAYNFQWANDDTDLLNTQGLASVYIGQTPATRVRFTLEPTLPDDGVTPVRWEATVKGARANQLQGVTVSPSYSAPYADTADQASGNGKLALPSIISAPTVLGQEDAEDYIRRVINEAIRLFHQAEVEGLLNPFIEPCETVSLDIEGAGWEDFHMFINGGHFHSDEDSATMALQLTRSRL